ncbi:MAG: CoA pyrophosphatase [Pseudomonadota bacterium]
MGPQSDMGWTDLDDFLRRAEARLDAPRGESRLPEGGDMSFQPEDRLGEIRPAAVLIGILPRPSGPNVLLTKRPATMPTHAGQVAFPGGKVEPDDADDVAAALREAHEEVGIDPKRTQLVGRGSAYLTGTAFRIMPVIGILPPDFQPVPDPTEVDEAFETPLGFLMDPTNHMAKATVWRGKERHYYEMPHNGYRIWGVTAGIIRMLYERLYGAEAT